MQVTVKDTHRWRSVIACSGMEFTKGVWRDVPVEFEKEVVSNPALEVRNSAPVVETFTEDKKNRHGRKPVETFTEDKKKLHGRKSVEVMTENAEEEQ